MKYWLLWAVTALVVCAPGAWAQQSLGSIRGVVYDKEFDGALPGVQVQLRSSEMDHQVTTSDQGNYLISQLPPGRYTVVFYKEGFVRELKDVVLPPGVPVVEVDVFLANEFTEMEEFFVQDIQIGAGTEASLLALRFDSPALLDSVSADLMSRAGAGDAASALRLVAGASVQDGKFAVIRGLPDRYVNSQLNSVRLPSADEETRAVELDQFPSAVIESIQVSKTFTPDQQGDASGGAVDVRLKGIPEETRLQLRGQFSVNSQVRFRDDFLTYKGGGLNFLGNSGSRDTRRPELEEWEGAVGVSTGDAPIDSKWAATFGGKHVFDNGVRFGGSASLFYERDSAYFDNGKNDALWVRTPGGPLVPQTNGGKPTGVPSDGGEFQTALFDVTQGEQSVQWGGLGSLGVETDNHYVGMTLLYTRTATDKATLAEDTRGKEFFFPGYDPNDPTDPGNEEGNAETAPYLRTETLEYTERTTASLQLTGRHRFEDALWDTSPELDWTLSKNIATLDQPDKRQFGTKWLGPRFLPPNPPFDPGGSTPAMHTPFRPAANINLGNVQRIFKEIEEDGEQMAVNLRFPFEAWNGEEGFFKVGMFADQVDRDFFQDTFQNADANLAVLNDEPFETFWSSIFPSQGPTYEDPLVDVNYTGEQTILAGYGMFDVPLNEQMNLIGGARVESTDLSTELTFDEFALWVPEGATQPLFLSDADPEEYNADISQTDLLPALNVNYRPTEQVTIRAAYSQTIARPVFRELTPALQQEFLGGPVFIGNPDTQLSNLDNYDLRFDYTPYEGSLVSLSWFRKDIDDPIEAVQRNSGFTFTTVDNFPKGRLNGIELEMRQDIGRFWNRAAGLSVGGNATFIDSEVEIPAVDQGELLVVGAPQETRDATNAPEFLYNLYATYDLERTGTQFGLFYTVKGDTLVAGATAASGNFVPDVYAREFGTLNASISQRLGRFFRLQVQGKNLTNPEIETVYRSEYIAGDETRTSFTRGFEVAVSLSAQITF